MRTAELTGCFHWVHRLWPWRRGVVRTVVAASGRSVPCEKTCRQIESSLVPGPTQRWKGASSLTEVQILSRLQPTPRSSLAPAAWTPFVPGRIDGQAP